MTDLALVIIWFLVALVVALFWLTCLCLKDTKRLKQQIRALEWRERVRNLPRDYGFTGDINIDLHHAKQAPLEVQLALNPLITDAAWAVGEMIGDPITAMPVVEKPREIENLLCVCDGILKYGLLASNRDKAALSQAVDDAECWLLNNCLSETTTD